MATKTKRAIEGEQDGQSVIQLETSLEDYRINRNGDHNCGVGVIEGGTGFLLFRDGCMAREISDARHGRIPQIEVQLPPQDDNARRHLVIRFLQASIAQKVHLYRVIERDVAEALAAARMGAGPMPPNDWQEDLPRLAKQIEKLREQLEAQEDRLPSNQDAQRYDREREERQIKVREAIQTLSQLPKI